MADNKIQFGLSNVYVALITDEATPAYDTPVAVPGAVTLTVDPDGDLAKFFADNIAYTTIASNNGYNGTLEMALVPDTVLADLLNWQIDENDMLVEIADAQPAPFALLYEVEGDVKKCRRVLYKCTVGRPKEENKTKGEKVDPSTNALPLMVMPIFIDDVTVVKGAMALTDTNASAYNAFFTAVTLPGTSVS